MTTSSRWRKRTKIRFSTMPTIHACMLCGAAEFRTIHQKAHWQYRCCQNCRLVSLHPQPTSRQFQAHYRDYLPHRNEQIGQWEAMMRPVNRQSAHLIEVKSHTGGQRLLDVGCGYGFFLREMRSRGWNVAGVEISQTGRRHALQVLGGQVQVHRLTHGIAGQRRMSFWKPS